MAESKKKDVSNDELIGFHKGSITTLLKERAELLKMVSVVEEILKVHISALKDLGVDISELSKKDEGSNKNNKKNIEEMI
jgi:intein-encoded DNA endonuclease-like protein